MNTTELLAPARDLECGMAALDCGADALYVGAPCFGARESAGNSLADIAALAGHAHRYWARVYVTLNTLLRDDELEPARRLAWQAYEAGADGLIVQDAGLLELELPPLPLIASTQMHNATPARVAFLEKVGFRRAILARELELEQIRAIRAAAPRIELECFIHGSLCVCYSGQCTLSYAVGGRSGNRGQCAQPCRKLYALADARGRTLATGHLLSLRDLNLSDHLDELLAAGVTSFKIEGRLKDRAYVVNAVASCRARLDAALARTGLRRGSSGTSNPGFTPDPAKTFNRDFTTYYLHGRGESPGRPATPKMTGEAIGPVTRIDRGGVLVETNTTLRAGDGLCFFDRDGELRGTTLNAAHPAPAGWCIMPDRFDGLEPGIQLLRNHDHEFLTTVKKSRPERRIAVRFTLRPADGEGLILAVEDEDGVRAEFALAGAPARAEKPDAARENIKRQLAKTGETEFACAEVTLETSESESELELEVPFLPVAALNALRRGALEALTAARAAARPRWVAEADSDYDSDYDSDSDRDSDRDSDSGGVGGEEYPGKELSYRGNVLNRQAEAFYRRHGVEVIEPAAEAGLDLRGRTVMTTRYCLLHHLGRCMKDSALNHPAEIPTEPLALPLTLIDEEGLRLELRFDCRLCQMEITLGRRTGKPA